MSDKANPGPDYQFQHLTAYPPDVMAQIEAIYSVSFPPHETKPFHYIDEAMQRNHYHVFVVSRGNGANGANRENGEIVAFLLLASLRVSKAKYIEYFAVTEPLRGLGIGSMMLRSVIDFFKDSDDSAIIWEVDPPEEPEKPGDINLRRIRFYERFGAHLVEKSKGYGMPNYWKGSGMLPLRLMWKPLHEDRAQPTKAELITLITDIFETEYPWGEAVRDEILANLENE